MSEIRIAYVLEAEKLADAVRILGEGIKSTITQKISKINNKKQRSGSHLGLPLFYFFSKYPVTQFKHLRSIRWDE